MTSISNRVGKLERDQLESAIARALTPTDMTDRELFGVMLEAEGIDPTAEAIDEHMRRFEESGELPGNLHLSTVRKPEEN